MSTIITVKCGRCLQFVDAGATHHCPPAPVARPLLGSPMPPKADWFGTREYIDPFQAGAAVAFGLMGMAFALRDAQGSLRDRGVER